MKLNVDLLKEVWFAVRHGRWSSGYEKWDGKPRLAFWRMYYDGWQVVLHLGGFWVECDY